MSGRLCSVLIAVCAVLGAAHLVWLWPIETEDAYIVYRFAWNLNTHGEWVYNLGERIALLTSPLHGLVVAALGRLSGDVPTANKIFGVACSVLAVAGLLAALRAPLERAAVAALVVASPFAALWAVGGLETPLLLAIVTAFSLLLRREMLRARPQTGGVYAVCALAGAAFVTRHDAGLVLAPAVLLLVGRHGLRRSVLPLLVGALAPAAWLGFAVHYYGDPLPNSFYAKTPRASVEDALYTLEFLLYSGLPVLGCVLAARLGSDPEGRRAWREHWRGFGWAWASFAMLLAYGCLTAATHMFYAFRLFVPFLPLAAVAAADLAARAGREAAGAARGVLIALAVVAAVQALSGVQISRHGGDLAGARSGEFRLDGAGDMAALVEAYAAPADVMRAHWSRQPRSRLRPMRVSTYAAGALPYALPEAYFYDVGLVSYRHRCKRTAKQLERASDYVFITTPDPTFRLEGHELVFQETTSFYLTKLHHLVFFNPRPERHDLPVRVDGPCPSGRRGAIPRPPTAADRPPG